MLERSFIQRNAMFHFKCNPSKELNKNQKDKLPRCSSPRSLSSNTRALAPLPSVTRSLRTPPAHTHTHTHGPTGPTQPLEPQPLKARPSDVPPRVSTKQMCLRCVHTRPITQCSGQRRTGEQKIREGLCISPLNRPRNVRFISEKWLKEEKNRLAESAQGTLSGWALSLAGSL